MKAFIIFCFFFFCFQGLTKELNSLEKKIVEQSETLVPESLALLKKIVNINSGTQNPKGVKKVGLVLKKEFERLGMSTRWVNIAETDRGGHLFAETKNLSAPGILIISHLDTVFSKDSSFQKFERIGDNKARGPGVNDAKGGIVILLAALKALKKAGVLKKINIKVAVMGDEEMPVADSKGPIRTHLVKLAKKSDIALGFEPSKTIDKATIARRGYTSWTIEVSGKGGHSSRIFLPAMGEGTNFSAFYILNRIRKTFKRHEYLTINPGLIIGGTNVELSQHGIKGQGFGKNNVIAQKTIITGDLRTLSSAQLRFAKKELRRIVSKSLRKTTAKIVFNEEDNYPPMAPTAFNKRLLEFFSQTNEDLGYGKVTSSDPRLRGAADIVFAVPHVKAAMDGLGALGTGAHSEQEDIDLSSIPKLIKRTSLFLYRLKDFNIN